jgi:hypothetical protein
MVFLNKKDILSYLMIVLLLLLASPVVEKRYALLIGVSTYADPDVTQLAGPKHDLEAMRKLLVSKWQFQPEDITVLQNQKATKARILQEIRNMESKSLPKDHIFIYFSGHGTSNNKADFSALPFTSGAMVPYDFKFSDNDQEMINSLVVGRWDLRPLLKRLDQSQRQLFIVNDSCFSGNSVRGKFSRDKFTTRYLNIPWDTYRCLNRITRVGQNKQDESSGYPYQNVYYLSAATDAEEALDLVEDRLITHPTFDNLPHGAFTDTFLRVLSGDLNADTNNDGQINYSEVKTSVLEFMRQRGYPHTPQSLPAVAEDHNGLAEKNIFNLEQAELPSPSQQSIASISTSENSGSEPLSHEQTTTHESPHPIRYCVFV